MENACELLPLGAGSGCRHSGRTRTRTLPQLPARSHDPFPLGFCHITEM